MRPPPDRCHRQELDVGSGPESPGWCVAIDEDAAPIVHLRVMCARIRAATAGRRLQGVRHDDADADLGTFGADDAIGFDPFPMLVLMQATGANYAVFGQVAGLLHGSNELTGDLDLLWDGDPVAA